MPSMISAAHYFPGDVIQRYHGPRFLSAECNTMPVLVFGCALVLLTRYVIQIPEASRITKEQLKTFLLEYVLQFRNNLYLCTVVYKI